MSNHCIYLYHLTLNLFYCVLMAHGKYMSMFSFSEIKFGLQNIANNEKDS